MNVEHFWSGHFGGDGEEVIIPTADIEMAQPAAVWSGAMAALKRALTGGF